MSFAILGMGTAVPATTLTQDEALGMARVLCCRTPEQNTWVPLIERIVEDMRAFGVDVITANCEYAGSQWEIVYGPAAGMALSRRSGRPARTGPPSSGR